ncbi:MAG: hypothetical protein FWF56_03665 [Firmicutes bacterium]|nr:hypothetical protein [Bacillota bacterium]
MKKIIQKIKENLYEEKKRRIDKFVEILKQQKHPLQTNQYKKLIRLMPRDLFVEDWLKLWIKESELRRQADSDILLTFIKNAIEKIDKNNAYEQIKENWNDVGLLLAKTNESVIKEVNKAKTQSIAIKRKSVFIPMFTITLLAIVAVSIFAMISMFGNNSIAIDILDPPLVNIVKYYDEDTMKIDTVPRDVYHELKQDNEILIFQNVVLNSSRRETYKNNPKHLFSDILDSMLVDVSDKNRLIAFDVDFKIRYEKGYEFEEYKNYFEPMLYEKCKFSIDEILIFYSNISYNPSDEINFVYLTFSYGKYDYFLTIKEFIMPSNGIIATELNDENIKSLAKNLMC